MVLSISNCLTIALRFTGSDKFFTAVVRPSSSSLPRSDQTPRRSSSNLLPDSVPVNLPLQIALGSICIAMGTAQVVSIPIYDQIINGHSDFYVVTLITGFWFSILTFTTWIAIRVSEKNVIYLMNVFVCVCV